eukprot:1194279-Prorocentrum_minimum.AAC.4
MHQSFDEETTVLNQSFGHLLGKGSAHVLGAVRSGMQWHVYIAQSSREDPIAPPSPRLTVEVCMTGLDPECASRFYMNTSHTAKAATLASGIADLFPTSEIDDLLFEPCGYSMNGLAQEGFSTIHITPQDGFSYASVELCGHPKVEISDLVEKVRAIFKPSQLVVALSSASKAYAHTVLTSTHHTTSPPSGLAFEGSAVCINVGPHAVSFSRFFSEKFAEKSDRLSNISDPRLACQTPPLGPDAERLKRNFSEVSFSSDAATCHPSTDKKPSMLATSQ